MWLLWSFISLSFARLIFGNISFYLAERVHQMVANAVIHFCKSFTGYFFPVLLSVPTHYNFVDGFGVRESITAFLQILKLWHK